MDYLWFMVDFTLISTDSDESNDILRSFRRLLESKCIENIILVLHNQALPHKRDDNHIRSIDDIMGRFSSLNEDKSRDIYVLVADDDDSAKNLVNLQEMMKAIFSKRRKG